MQAITAAPGNEGSARLEAVRDPEPLGGELLIETLEVGVCGTDRTIVAGRFGSAPPGKERLILGHESLGVLRQSGGGFETGDLVAATVRRPCGHCPNCDTGEVDACITGDFFERGIIGLDGFAAELFSESPSNLVGVPKVLGRLGVLGEPMSICERGWRHAMVVGGRQGWQPRRALVLGVGTIGVLSALLARLHGLEVCAYARRPSQSSRAALLRSVGAEYCSSSDWTLGEISAEVGQPDLILEAAGDPDLTVEAISCLGPNGVLCLRGINPRPDRISVPADLFTDQIVLANKAIVGSTNASPRDWVQGYEDMAAIAIRWPHALPQVIGSTVEPDRFHDALEGDAIKATIRFA